MSTSHRLPYITLRGCLIGVIFWTSAALGQTGDPSDTPQDPKPAAQQTKPIEQPSLAPVEQDTRSREHKSLCDSPKNAEEADLCQQWRMAEAAEKQAKWTQRQFWITVAEVAGLLLTVGFVAWTASVAVRSAKAAEAAVKITSDTAQHQLRAYVSRKNIIWKRNIDTNGGLMNFDVVIVWENCGATPARRCRSRINSNFFKNAIPKDFDYADSEGDDLVTELSYIGPGQIIQSSARVSVVDAQAVARQEKSLFVWGWIEYDDIFENTPRRRTEVCIRVGISVDCSGCLPMVIGPFNGSDDDCLHKPKT